MTREQWLAERLNGIGASEAAAVMGMSPHTTNEQLWRLKTRRADAVDISDKPYVAYGVQAEEHLRALFALDHPRYMVEYEPYEIIRNTQYPFIFATLDGQLLEMDDSKPMPLVKRRGILEIKTTEILRSGQWDEWNNQIPNHYYIQVLHQLLATGWDFAYLYARIKWRRNGELQITERYYPVERILVQEDIDYLLQEEIKFWDSVQQGKRPALILPAI